MTAIVATTAAEETAVDTSDRQMTGADYSVFHHLTTIHRQTDVKTDGETDKQTQTHTKRQSDGRVGMR